MTSQRRWEIKILAPEDEAVGSVGTLHSQITDINLVPANLSLKEK